MNPYKTIWLKPAATIEYVLDSGWKVGFVNLNFVVAALVLLLEKLTKYDNITFIELITFVILIAINFLVFKYVLPYLWKLIGKIWQGKASVNQIRLIFSVSLIPQLILLSSICLIFIVTGTLTEPNGVLYFISGLFSLSIMIIGMSKIQRFTYVLAFVNIFMPYFIISLLLLLIRN